MKQAALFLCVLWVFSSCDKRGEKNNTTDILPSQADAHTFIDDDGKTITFNTPCRRIISLYSVHTENLFTIGAGEYLIGVQSSGPQPSGPIPKELEALPKYTYSGDPEYIIAAHPDLVLIRPFIRRQGPDYINELEMAGIFVVSLYPEGLDDFDEYIMRLAMLTGREKESQEKLRMFHDEIEHIMDAASNIKDKQKVFFESTEHEVRTVAADSLPAKAIEAAGGINLAGGAEAIRPGSSIASFGAEKVLELAGEIDVYIVQQGAMNQTKDRAALAGRPAFSAIKAIREGRVLFIDENLISSPTFHYPEAIREIARFLYPVP
jgi:iron complex transport system substrate-binding protein